MSQNQIELKKAKRKMKSTFNLIGLALLTSVLIKFLLDIVKKSYWVYYLENLNVFSYGFSDNIFSIISIILTYFIPFFFISIVLRKGRQTDVEKIDLTLLDYFGLAFTGISIYLLLSVMTSGLVFLLSTKSVGISQIPPSITSNYIEVFVSYLFYYILVVPLVEEYVFRGVILRNLGRYGQLFGLLSSSFFFALSFGRLQTALPGFFLGIFLGFLTILYKSIKPAIVCRIAIAVFSLIEMLIPLNRYWIFGVICIIVYSGTIAYLLMKRRKVVLKLDFNISSQVISLMTSPFVFLSTIISIVLTYFNTIREIIVSFIMSFL